MKGFVKFQTDGGSWIGLNVFNIAYYVSCHTGEHTCIHTTDGDKHTVKSSFAEVQEAFVSALADVCANTQSEELNISDIYNNAWIPVENEFPEPYVDVSIAYVRKNPKHVYTDCIAYNDEGTLVNSYNGEPIKYRVTHWKPLEDDFIPGGTR